MCLRGFDYSRAVKFEYRNFPQSLQQERHYPSVICFIHLEQMIGELLCDERVELLNVLLSERPCKLVQHFRVRLEDVRRIEVVFESQGASSPEFRE